MDKIDFPDILEQARNFGLENCDIIDAIFSAEVMHKGMAITDGQRAAFAMKQTYKEVPYMTIENGRRVKRYRKVPQFQDAAHEQEFNRMKPIK